MALSPLPQLRPQLAPHGAEPEQTGALDVSSGLSFQGWRPQAFNPGPGSLLGKGEEKLVKPHVDRAGLWGPSLPAPEHSPRDRLVLAAQVCHAKLWDLEQFLNLSVLP